MSKGRRTAVTLEVADFYYQGEDAYFGIEHRVSGALTDATAVPTVTVTDHVGAALFTAQDSTKDSTGDYHYECVIPAAAVCGDMKVQVSSTYDSITRLDVAVSQIRETIV